MKKRNQQAEEIIVVNKLHPQQKLLHEAIRVECCIRSWIAEIE